MLLWSISGSRAPLECIDELSKSLCWSKGFGLAVRIPLLLLLRSLHAQRILTAAGSRNAYAVSHRQQQWMPFQPCILQAVRNPLKRRQDNPPSSAGTFWGNCWTSWGACDTHLGMMRVTALSACRSCGARLDSLQPATDCQRLPTPSELCWVQSLDSMAPCCTALSPSRPLQRSAAALSAVASSPCRESHLS